MDLLSATGGEVFPLSFAEFLKFRGLKHVPYSRTSESHMGEIAALEEGAARFPRAPRALVAHEHTTRKPPAGIEVVDAWRHLLATQSPSGVRPDWAAIG